MVEIITPRLRLIALDLRHLRLLRQDRTCLLQALQLVNEDLILGQEMAEEMEKSLDFWLLNVESHPKTYAWYTRWEIILTAENRNIGSLGFNGFPDKQGDIMVGYAIDERYQNRGFATESLKALIDWASTEETLKTISAETYLDNHASNRVLKKNQFTVSLENDQTILWVKSISA